MQRPYASALRLLFSAFFVAIGSAVFAQSATLNMATMVGRSQGTQFNGTLLLSDSTLLIAGESPDLSWVPIGVPVTNLDTGGIRVVLPDVRRRAISQGFIARISADHNQILQVVTIPRGRVASINKIKTNTLPGAATGDLYISGRIVGNDYFYIAKLDANFISGVPSGLSYLSAPYCGHVGTGGSHGYDGTSYHVMYQPFDVASDGSVVYGRGDGFDFNWSAIEKLDPTGRLTTVPNWPAQYAVIDSIDPAYAARYQGKNREFDTTLAGVPTHVRIRVNQASGTPDSFTIARVGAPVFSTIVLKTYRYGGFRSKTQAQYDFVGPDENGNPGRKGAMPDDFYNPGPCNSSGCPAGQGYTGYTKGRVFTARIGDVVIDKRSSDVYLAYTYPTSGPQGTRGAGYEGGGEFDYQAQIVALDVNGNMRWFGRMMREAIGGNPANQYVDRLALDYANDRLLVLARTFDTCRYNLFRGDEIVLGGPRNAVQNAFTGATHQIEVSWLGSYTLNGRIAAATYIGELDQAERGGALFLDPNLSRFPDPNSGNPNLAWTRADPGTEKPTGANVLSVDAAGRVYVNLYTKVGRPITSLHAFQQQTRPDQIAPQDSAAATSVSFARVYAPDLQKIAYSTLLAPIYNQTNGAESDNLFLTGATPIGGGMAIVGYHNGKHAYFPSLNKPGYGTDSLNTPGGAGILATLQFGCNSGPFGPPDPIAARPGPITGPPIHCVGTTANYHIAPVAGAASYQWFLPDTNWKGASQDTLLSLTSMPGRGGQLRVVSRNLCSVSNPNYFDLTTPLATPIAFAQGVNCGAPDTTSVLLRVRGGVAGSYHWFTQASGGTALPGGENGSLRVRNLTGPTPYYVSYASAGCESLRAMVIAPFGQPAAAPVVSQAGLVLSVPAPPSGITVQWFKDGQPIPGATQNSYTVTEDGQYTAGYVNRCGPSLGNTITSIKTTSQALTGWSFSPNPTTAELYVNAPANALEVFTLYNAQGKAVRTYPAGTPALSLHDMPAGMYYLQVGAKGMARIVKQ